MAEPLWHSYDSNKCLKRQQLELIVQKKKLSEIYTWFQNHFKDSTPAEYMKQCPFVIIQGPTGCGKTTTLKFVANELKIPIKEYSEITDVTAINLDLSRSDRDQDETISGRNNSLTIDRRKALKFEHFVLNSLRYNTLYPADEPPADADSDCDFDKDDSFAIFSRPRNPPPSISGVIIHVDTPLTFARSQRILIKTLQNLIRTIQGVSRHLKRRIAIVFETLEGDNETLPLPTKVKQTFGIQIFKFNPIIRSNMKRFIETMVAHYNHVIFDKVAIEQLVNDCDGDLRACINTLQIICNKPNGTNALAKIDHNASQRHGYANAEPIINPFYMSAVKKQKTFHGTARLAHLAPSLMRDNTRATSFFHALGKILHQKRLYPERDTKYLNNKRIYRSIDRPYPTENSTDYLANLTDVEPKNLITWLHHYYYKYCGDSNIEKAALLLDNLSMTDCISLNSLQSSQFYEMHSSLDQLQTHLAIESTVYSLYQNNYNLHNTSHKKISSDNGQTLIIKPSVENIKVAKSDLFISYSKPLSMNIPKVIEEFQKLLSECTVKLIEINETCIDPSKVLLDYAPYLAQLSDRWQATLTESRGQEMHPIFDVEKLDSCFRALQTMNDTSEGFDIEVIHENLQQLIEGIL